MVDSSSRRWGRMQLKRWRGRQEWTEYKREQKKLNTGQSEGLRSSSFKFRNSRDRSSKNWRNEINEIERALKTHSKTLNHAPQLPRLLCLLSSTPLCLPNGTRAIEMNVSWSIRIENMKQTSIQNQLRALLMPHESPSSLLWLAVIPKSESQLRNWEKEMDNEKPRGFIQGTDCQRKA